MSLAANKSCKAEKERSVTAKVFGELQSLLVKEIGCLKREEQKLWKPEGAAKRPHSKTGWNQSSLAKQWRPNPAEACCTMPQRVGMRSSLQGKRARLAGELHFPIGARHGSRDGQTVIVESEIQSINAPTVTKWYGRSAECRSNLANCPATCGFWLRVVRGCEAFANLADKSRACLVRLTGSEGDLSRRVNCYVSYAGI